MKTVHMISFCTTRMSYILTVSKQTVANFFLLYNVTATTSLKLEKGTTCMSPKVTIFLHLLADPIRSILHIVSLH